MNTRLIITAGGRANRWGDYMGVPKQMCAPDGEPLVHRLVRQARDHGVTDVWIVTKDKRIAAPGARREMPRLDKANYQSDRFMSSRHLWLDEDPAMMPSNASRNIVLYGDVWLSDEGAEKVYVESQRHVVRMLGRPWPNHKTGKDHGEIFGVTWAAWWSEKLLGHLYTLIGLQRDGLLTRSLGHELARQIAGVRHSRLRTTWAGHTDLERKQLLDVYTVIDDWTDDFDWPDDFTRWQQRRADYGLLRN